MRSECSSCKKSFSGAGIIVSQKNEEKIYCADCFWKIRAEYDKKKSCEDCSYFDQESCDKRGKPLIPVKAGFNTYFVEAETCRDFSIEQKESSKKKIELTEERKEAAALIKTVSEKGQTLTYYCCHCGAPLKIGLKATRVQKTCPSCGGDLEIINLSKLINQHANA